MFHFSVPPIQWEIEPRNSLQIVLKLSAFPIIELTMSMRKKYNITTCASVNNTGGTMIYKIQTILPLVALTEAQVVILHIFTYASACF